MLMLTDSEGRKRSLVITWTSGDRPMWHCKMSELDSGKVEWGKTPHAIVTGMNYKLFDPGRQLGTLLNFSLDKVDTDAIYHVNAAGKILMFRVLWVGKKGKGLFPGTVREVVLPEGPNMQSTSGYIAGIGDSRVQLGNRR